MRYFMRSTALTKDPVLLINTFVHVAIESVTQAENRKQPWKRVGKEMISQVQWV